MEQEEAGQPPRRLAGIDLGIARPEDAYFRTARRTRSLHEIMIL